MTLNAFGVNLLSLKKESFLPNQRNYLVLLRKVNLLKINSIYESRLIIIEKIYSRDGQMGN